MDAKVPPPTAGSWFDRLWPLVLLLLIAGTCLAVASVSPWLVVPYLALMAWMVMSPGRSGSRSAGPSPASTPLDGREPAARNLHLQTGSDRPAEGIAAPASGWTRKPAKGSAPTREAAGPSLAGPSTAPPTPAMPEESQTAAPSRGPDNAAPASARAPRKRRPRGSKAPTTPPEPSLPVEVVWVRVGPNQFVRKEIARSEEEPNLRPPEATEPVTVETPTENAGSALAPAPDLVGPDDATLPSSGEDPTGTVSHPNDAATPNEVDHLRQPPASGSGSSTTAEMGTWAESESDTRTGGGFWIEVPDPEEPQPPTLTWDRLPDPNPDDLAEAAGDPAEAAEEPQPPTLTWDRLPDPNPDDLAEAADDPAEAEDSTASHPGMFDGEAVEEEPLPTESVEEPRDEKGAPNADEQHRREEEAESAWEEWGG